MSNFPARALGGLSVLLLALTLVVIIEQPISRAAPLTPGAPPTWGTDIRVSPVFTTTPDAQVNYALAVDPTNPDRVLAGYDSYGFNGVTSGYALSSDAGRTWTGDRFYATWISNTMASGNTSVGFDRQSTAYLVSQILGPTATGYVVLTTTTGSTWSWPVPIVLSDYSQYRNQAHLAIDARPSGSFAGSLYVAWRYFTTGPQGIWLRYSRDAGRTWSQDVPVSDVGNEAGEQPSIQVAGDGSIYTAFGANDTNLYLDRSTDGGVTWGTDQAITGGPITAIGGLDAEGHELLLLGGSSADGVVINNDPAIAISASDPRTVYAVWNDGRWETDFTIYGHIGRHADVAFSRSTDAGVTWSAPIRLNDDAQGNGIDQWAPSIATGPDGRVGVTWNDRRDDPNHLLYDRYYTESTDGGLTWSANSRINTSLNSAVARYNGDGNGDMGDYTSLVYGPDYVLPSWIDTRAGRVQDFYVNRGTFVPAPPTPVPSTTPTPQVTATGTTTSTPAATRPVATATATSGLPTATPTICTLSFTDVHPTDYFYTPVQYLACHGVISGYANGDGTFSFRPYNQTTRAQMVKIVVLGFARPIVTPPGGAYTFADVPPSHPFFAVIETAAADAIVSGYTCGGPGEPCDSQNRPYFRPYTNVTRGQLSKIDVVAAGWALVNPVTPSFEDVVPNTAFYEFVETAFCHGIISGYTCGGVGEPCDSGQRPYFRPAASATRGQIAKIVDLSITGSALCGVSSTPTP